VHGHVIDHQQSPHSEFRMQGDVHVEYKHHKQ